MNSCNIISISIKNPCSYRFSNKVTNNSRNCIIVDRVNELLEIPFKEWCYLDNEISCECTCHKLYQCT